MDPDRLDVELRPRNGWESIDLGFALARRWLLPLLALWWLGAAIPALLLIAVLGARPDLWLLAVWWLKPVYESLLLLWLSRALFGAAPPPLSSVRRVADAFPPRLWTYLLWRRLDVSRSYTMPVVLLEGLSGRARRDRVRALCAGGCNAGRLTIICVHFEAVLWVAALLALAFLVPQPLPTPDLAAALFDASDPVYWLGSLCMLGAMSLIAPFYVAAGLALYLGRRTELEAWDLELRLRRLLGHGRRPDRPGAKARVGAGSVAAALAALLLGLGAAALPPAVWARPMPTSAEASQAIEEVLAGDDFGSLRDEERWVYVGGGSDEGLADWPRWLPADLLTALARGLKWALGMAAAIALVLLVHRLWGDVRGLRPGRKPRDEEGTAPESTGDGRSRPSSLPDDVRAAARGLLAAGDARGALSLLYRAQIAQLRGAGLRIPVGATEADLLWAAEAVAAPAELDRLRRLTGLWQSVAYAHRAPDLAEVETLLAAHPTRGGPGDG